MEKCKFCNAELPENSTVCPSCGEVIEAKKLSAGKGILAIAAVVAVLVLAVGIVFFNSTPAAAESTETTAPAEVLETVPAATVPADGNPDDATCKGTYTAADDAVVAARDTVVAVIGERELTLGQLQVYYWRAVYDFLNEYSAYAAYFGLDYQQPLDTQLCTLSDSEMTWQQYFLGFALDAWQTYSSMAEEAEAEGIILSDYQQEVLSSMAEQLDAQAEQYGYASGEEMIHINMGAGASMEDYVAYLETFFKANMYYSQVASGMTPTEEELSAFFDEHADEYAQSGLTKDMISVDVRHILVFPKAAEGEDEDSEEAWAAGEAAANALLEQWKAGEMTEESFAALANEHSEDPGSNTNGGLYEGVTEGQMVQAFNDWCFDPARQVGDTDVVRTEYGFHVMFFSGSAPMWKTYAEGDYVTSKANEAVAAVTGKDAMTVKYGDILLANVDLA